MADVDPACDGRVHPFGKIMYPQSPEDVQTEYHKAKHCPCGGDIHTDRSGGYIMRFCVKCQEVHLKRPSADARNYTRPADGNRVGGAAPWGFCYSEGVLVPCKRELLLNKKIAELRAGGLTVLQVAEKLNTVPGAGPRRSKFWTERSIQTRLAAMRKANLSDTVSPPTPSP